MKDDDIVIVAAKRTPIGSLLGQCSTLSAPQLAAETHRAALTQAGLKPQHIDDVIMGCVLQAGIGQAPARQSALYAGIPEHIGATTINKMCGSGMKAVMLAHDQIKAGSASCVLAGGMENMSQAPYLLAKARGGYRLGHGQLIDHMFLDGLEDAYQKGKLMGEFADETAAEYGLTREAQDQYAAKSMQRALAAQANGYFNDEIVAIDIEKNKTKQRIDKDEGPSEYKLTKIPQLKPAFSTEGTVTAANSSAISDGAASLIIMSGHAAKAQGIKPLAKIIAHASHAELPERFTIAPIGAIQKVLDRAGWKKDDVDLFEINEAFAVVAMVAIQQLALNTEKVNINGGACALGHPIGASGARIIVTLLHALQQKNQQKGIAALCIGGGEATALAIERIV